MCKTALSVTALLAFLVGCQQQARQNDAPAARTATSTGGAKVANEKVGKTPPKAAGHSEGDHDCVHEKESKRVKGSVTEQTGPGGQSVLHAGSPFSAAAAKVTIANLLATPDTFKGKIVQVDGKVSAMCHHRRGWFSIVGDDSSSRFLRVVTAPAFFVPEGAIGKSARAEGKVEVVEVNAAMAHHYARDHKMGDPLKVKGPEKRVVLRATGAEFI